MQQMAPGISHCIHTQKKEHKLDEASMPVPTRLYLLKALHLCNTAPSAGDPIEDHE